jgi:hypothetical protein
MAMNSGIVNHFGELVPTFDEDGFELENNYVNIERNRSSLFLDISYNYTDELGVNLELVLENCK